jgi:multiple sugar transport system substrate-binding protein
MTQITRRKTLTLAGGGLASTALGGLPARAAVVAADVQPPHYDIEKGATLRVLRPAKFVEPDEAIFRANTKKFSEASGVPVRVDFVGFEDLRPQTAVAANTGAGPDIVIAWPDDPHLYVDRIVEMTDLAEYLGRKYGGWQFLAERYGKKWGTDTWIGLPMGGSGAPCVYRISWVKEAGFETIPTDLDQFLALCRKLKQNGHPPGFALGNAVGDANGYCNWLLWSHGGSMIDPDGHVAINRPETFAALAYARELYQTFIPGVLSWQDPSNNKVFAAGDIGLTQNGVSIYYALKNNPKTAALAEDVGHAPMPFGPVGKPPESALLINAMLFRHSPYPNAAKEYLRFMMEVEQYERWLTGCLGYWAQPLKAYAEAAIWSSDPKLLPYRDTCAHEFWNGYQGPISAASGAVNAEYVNVHMFASVSVGQATPEEAVAEAGRRMRRYYKT